MTNPYKHETRRRRTPKQIAAIFAARGGCCHVCERKLWPGDIWDLDHIIPLENGGTDDDDNLAPACTGKTGDCHSVKTAKDHGDRAKGQRVYEKTFLPRFITQSKSSRPIPGSRASGYKKRLNGEVVKR